MSIFLSSLCLDVVTLSQHVSHGALSVAEGGLAPRHSALLMSALITSDPKNLEENNVYEKEATTDTIKVALNAKSVYY
jgi:hypothetical protein